MKPKLKEDKLTANISKPQTTLNKAKTSQLRLTLQKARKGMFRSLKQNKKRRHANHCQEAADEKEASIFHTLLHLPVQAESRSTAARAGRVLAGPSKFVSLEQATQRVKVSIQVLSSCSRVLWTLLQLAGGGAAVARHLRRSCCNGLDDHRRRTRVPEHLPDAHKQNPCNKRASHVWRVFPSHFERRRTKVARSSYFAPLLSGG